MVSLDAALAAQQFGSIRGIVTDQDFDVPVAGAEVTIVGLPAKAATTDQGNYLLREVRPGTYTLVFARDGYVRQVRSGVVVAEGKLVEVDVALAGDFTDMEEYIVQDILQMGGGTETELLQVRFESPSLMDSISADLMSRAGVSDAAAALRLVAGASLQDGKSAVIRGLPDRYVSSQMNGVRLPSADEDKRAVELDQFPAAVIESIQVTKTFMPDQQGDASGGAVDVRLKGVPSEPLLLQWKMQVGHNTQAAGRNTFLSYDGGGVHFWGKDGGDRAPQLDNLGENWDGAVGVSPTQAPIDFKWSGAFGGSHEISNGVRLGAFVSVFYEQDTSHYSNGIDDSYWVDLPGEPMTPQISGGGVLSGDFHTRLFDVVRSEHSVQWGSLATVGLESDTQSISLAWLYTRTAEDAATLAEDTRGKEFFFPGYDPNNPATPGHSQPDAAPYLRQETLNYTERTTDTLQLSGSHTLPIGGTGAVRSPLLDWTLAHSTADAVEPDKRQFGSKWSSVNGGTWAPLKPAANINLGNLQRIYETIEEESTQYSADLKLPFEQWAGVEGYLKVGTFHDDVERTFDQDTFSNFGDISTFSGPFEQFWSASFPFESHPITASEYDVDYEGAQKIGAWYGMLDLPLATGLSVVGGVRFENTRISIVNMPESLATWFPPGALTSAQLNPGDADVSIDESDALPAIGLVYDVVPGVTVRAAYAETVARQTFKELTPILQQDYLGGPIFIGNPELEMSALRNYDLRVDYVPYAGSLFSASWFKKDVDNPIEYVQRLVATFDFTTAINEPSGELHGYEFEVRQDLGNLSEALADFGFGVNTTLINSHVNLSQEEIDGFNQAGIEAPMTSRDMSHAPEFLLNLYLTWECELTGTKAGLFYTAQGDTLIAGAGQANDNLVPSVYLLAYDTLNFSIAQKVGQGVEVFFQAKNLTDPDIQEVYRSPYIGNDVTKTSYTRGIDFSLGVGGSVKF